ncbi:hypothetical protein FQR65_LT05524 [Abscondita terminalis]|nr:hypothetical protein FQR65_LT05524 [Abscondita terminalis]
MPRYFEATTVFNFTWDQVARGFWQKYPNPNSTHVLTEDTVLREVRSGKLFSKRLIRKTNPSPKWADRFITTKNVNIIEESIVDPQTKTLTTYTRNLGYLKVMSVTEKVIYKESEEFPGKTVAIRSAWIDSQIKGLGRAICAFGYERFKKNCNKMVGGFNYVLGNMFPPHNSPTIPVHSIATTKSKLKDAAKNASELAKAKAAPIYASLHPNQS